MKITEKVLQALSGTKEGNTWRVKSNGYHLLFRKIKNNVWEFCLDTPDGEEHSHHVSDIEEVFGCLCNDLFRDGYDDARKQLHEWLSGEEDYITPPR